MVAASWQCVSSYSGAQCHEGKTSMDLLEQEVVSGSGSNRAICKSAPRPDLPLIFYRPDALPAAV